MDRYTIYQERQLYQLFPDRKGHPKYAVLITPKYSRFDYKCVWDRYLEYRENGWISDIEEMINKDLTYDDIIKELDL